MEVIQVLTNPILPVFAIMALGFIIGRMGVITVDEARIVNKFAMTILMPILAFDLLVNAPIYSFDPLSLFVYVGGQFIVFGIGYFIASRLFKMDPAHSVLLAFCGIFGNNVLYILPIAELLYGADNLLPIATIITWDTAFTFCGAIVALQLIQLGKVSPQKVALTLGKNPILVFMTAGLILALLRIDIPNSFQVFLDFNSAAAAPVALFALGVVLSQTKFNIDAPVATFTVIKFIIFPAIIWLGFTTLAPNSFGEQQFLLGAAAPTGAMAFTLAFLYGVRTDVIAQVIVITSVITLGSLAWLA